MTEAETQVAIRLALGTIPGLILWRNNCGEAWQGQVACADASAVVLRHPRRVNFGVASPGGADLVGIKAVTVTPDMVGQVIGLFIAIEVKTPSGRIKPDQQNFLNTVRSLGALAGVARSADEARAIVFAAREA